MDNPLTRVIALLNVARQRLMAQPRMALLSLLGLMLPAAMMMSIPLYTDNIYRRVLIERIDTTEVVYRTQSLFDFVFHYNGGYGRRAWDEVRGVDDYIVGEAGATIGLPYTPVRRYLLTQAYELYPGEMTERADTPPAWGQVGFVSNVAEHITLTEGRFPPAGASGVGPIHVIVSQAQANAQGLRTGDSLTLFAPEERVRIPVKVSGVWQPTNLEDPFWFIAPQAMDDWLLAPESAFEQALGHYVAQPVYMAWWFLSADAGEITTADVDPLIAAITAVRNRAQDLLPKITMTTLPLDMLSAYKEATRILTVRLTLYSLPVLGLLVAFTVLTALLTVQRQRNEIAMLRSRGVSTGQVMGLVSWEGLILGIAALALSLPASFGLAQAISRTRSFLDFSGRAPFALTLNHTGMVLGLAALGTGVVAHLLPAREAAGKTIVDYKRARSRVRRKPWWQRMGFDLLLLAPSGYGAYLLRTQRSLGILDPLQNRNPFQNPLLFLVPALAALALTLLALRVMPKLFAALAWTAGATRSISLVQAGRHLARTPSAHMTPVLLLVMTLSLASYTASLAGTLDRDLHDRAYYRVGADMSFLEIGEGGPEVTPSDFTGQRQVTLEAPPSLEQSWTFPPVLVYHDLPGAQDVTRVGRYAATWREMGYRSGAFLGVDPSDFVRVAFWREDFASEDLGTLMTRLNATFDGLLLPCELMQYYTVGDTVRLSVSTFRRTDEVDFSLAGCFDLFPTWYPERDPASGALTNALFVANLDYLYQTIGQTYPFEVWLTLERGLDFIDISNRPIGGANVYRKGWGWDAPRLDIHAEQERPHRQGLLGVLSVGFIAAAALSVAGFILYLLISLQQRVVEFGVLRAVGLSMRQMTRTLAWEVAILLLVSIVLGSVLGAGISRAFIPYLQVGALEQSLADQAGDTLGTTNTAADVPPYVVKIDWGAALSIYVLFGLLFVAALVILVVRLRRLRIFEAIKLGETL